MGAIVEFTSNGGNSSGYVAVPEAGEGTPVLVIQEYWGLVPHITDVCDRFAAEGFTALAPDLYHGTTTTEPDEAGKLMMTLNLAQASTDLTGALAELQRRTAKDEVGVVGFCMGGGLALRVACDRPAAIGACVAWYGLIPWEGGQPDWSLLQAPVLGHYGSEDEFFTPDKVQELEQTLRDHDKAVELKVHPGLHHAFFNDTRPEVYDAEAAAATWAESLAFLRANLGS